MTKLSKFRPSSTSRQVTWVRFHWNYIFISSFSYRKAWQLASKIVSALSEQNISQASYFENSLFRIKQLTMFAAHEVPYWFRVSHFYITIQSNESNCNSIKCSCAAGCQHRFYKCMYVWMNSSHCCMIGTSARPNLAPTRFATAVWTFALWWHSKGKYILHFIAETAAPNCPIPSISLQFSIETRLESESSEPLIKLLAFLVEKLWSKINKLICYVIMGLINYFVYFRS